MIPLLLFASVFTTLFVLYSKWQFEHAKQGYYNLSPEAVKASDKWHMYGMLMRVSAVAYPLVAIYFPPTWQDVVLAASIGAPLWDMLINIIALDKWAFYVGKRDNDQSFEWDNVGHLKWLAYGIFIAMAIIAKIYIN